MPIRVVMQETVLQWEKRLPRARCKLAERNRRRWNTLRPKYTNRLCHLRLDDECRMSARRRATLAPLPCAYRRAADRMTPRNACTVLVAHRSRKAFRSRITARNQLQP